MSHHNFLTGRLSFCNVYICQKWILSTCMRAVGKRWPQSKCTWPKLNKTLYIWMRFKLFDILLHYISFFCGISILNRCFFVSMSPYRSVIRHDLLFRAGLDSKSFAFTACNIFIGRLSNSHAHLLSEWHAVICDLSNDFVLWTPIILHIFTDAWTERSRACGL